MSPIAIVDHVVAWMLSDGRRPRAVRGRLEPIAEETVDEVNGFFDGNILTNEKANGPLAEMFPAEMAPFVCRPSSLIASGTLVQRRIAYQLASLSPPDSSAVGNTM